MLNSDYINDSVLFVAQKLALAQPSDPHYIWMSLYNNCSICSLFLTVSLQMLMLRQVPPFLWFKHYDQPKSFSS